MQYLGTTLRFPIQLVNGCPINAEGTEAVDQSLLDILSTCRGTIFYHYDYGSRNEELIFEQNDDVLKSLLEIFIEDAISGWEKRTKFVDVDFEITDAMISATIYHELVGVSTLASTVYTFYRKN